MATIGRPRRPEKVMNPVIFEKFVEWCALPEKFRKPKTMHKFAREYHMSAGTLTKWRQRPSFWPRVEALTASWVKGMAPDIKKALVESALLVGREGNADRRLYAQWFERLQEPATESALDGIAALTEFMKLMMQRRGALPAAGHGKVIEGAAKSASIDAPSKDVGAAMQAAAYAERNANGGRMGGRQEGFEGMEELKEPPWEPPEF